MNERSINFLFLYSKFNTLRVTSSIAAKFNQPANHYRIQWRIAMGCAGCAMHKVRQQSEGPPAI